MILSCSFLVRNKLASDMCLQAPAAVCCMSYSANMAVFWKMFLQKCVWKKNAGGNCCWIYTTWKNLWKKKAPIILGISGYPPPMPPPPRNDALLSPLIWPYFKTGEWHDVGPLRFPWLKESLDHRKGSCRNFSKDVIAQRREKFPRRLAMVKAMRPGGQFHGLQLKGRFLGTGRDSLHP